jgi:hypothetical protein
MNRYAVCAMVVGPCSTKGPHVRKHRPAWAGQHKSLAAHELLPCCLSADNVSALYFICLLRQLPSLLASADQDVPAAAGAAHAVGAAHPVACSNTTVT